MNISIDGIEDLMDDEQDGVEEIIYTVLRASGLDDYSVNVALVDAATIKDLYFRFKNKKKVTDVLSFPTPEMEKIFPHTKNLLGDIVICIDQARSQATELGHSLKEEIAVLCAHGLFHLLGYDHERSSEEADMQMQGEMQLLERAGLSLELNLIGRVGEF